MPSVFDWIGIGTTLAISALCLIFDTFLLMNQSCNFDFSDINDNKSSFSLFLQQHIKKESCPNQLYSNSRWKCDASPSKFTAITGDDPYPYTDPDSVMLFIIFHLILHMVWAFITSGVLLGQSSRRWNFLWLYSTASVLLYGGVVAGLFTVEIVEAKGCFDAAFKSEADKEVTDFATNFLQAQLVIPIYMSYGVVFWIFVLVLWCMMLAKVICKPSSGTKKDKPRSLSEAHSEDFSQKMNKRFNKAKNIEEDESGGSQDTLVKRSNVLPHHAPPPRESSSDWVYANPALVMDFDMVTSRGVPSSEAAVSSAAPKSFQNRTLSESSEASDGRRLGRPNSMPPLPAIDYKLPRASVKASVTRPVDRENRQKSSRKAIRTPSGKNMSASDYLRGGYRPSEKSLSEEDAGVHRYFVKLKE